MTDEPNTDGGLRQSVQPPAHPDPGAESAELEGPVSGRAAGIGITLLLFALLIVSWFVQLSFALQGEFGPPEDRLSGGGMLGGFILGAVIAIAPPIVTLILQARVHKRTPRHSIIAAVGAAVVLIIAVPINAIVIGLQAVSVISGN
ncbi:hypothetical protein A4X17_01930 [Plantibacter sp. H53]|uniref:hypothetical protein n=1 Tax=Plantibacter sp. H53 TaxID=1827323 RepID=UPI0007D8EBBA|nr:hypothetical protein [Plantibacter sp. H53]OAN35561.1 hypothetical protein A4X17_01930 [Plantibacter sp. H53]